MTSGLEILTVAETAAADSKAVAAGVKSLELMENAGRAVADAICARWTPRPTAVLCGPGNNGGDGYVVARLLKRRGWPVWVEAESEPESEDARAMARRWRGPVRPLEASDNEAELVVDALFGAGLTRPLSGVASARAKNADRRKVVAIDLPSGIHGDTGPTAGESFTAGLTITFHRLYPAHVLQPSRTQCGEIQVADIGLGPVSSTVMLNQPQLWKRHLPWPDVMSHKHRRGRMAVVSGGPWNTGAARLAARAGLRAGAGLVTVLSPPEALAVNASHLEAVMLRPIDTEADLAREAESMDAVVIGPAAGVGPATASMTQALVKTGAALVVDADAITSFQEEPERLFSMLDRDDVLTPHAGEFHRLFPDLLASSPERITAAQTAAERAGCIVLLKGPDTVVASPDGRASVNTAFSPWLATAGSGDVLAGLVGGLISQGMSSFEAASAAVWIHSEAGSNFGPGLIAEDLPGLIPPVLKRFYGRT